MGCILLLLSGDRLPVHVEFEKKRTLDCQGLLHIETTKRTLIHWQIAKNMVSLLRQTILRLGIADDGSFDQGSPASSGAATLGRAFLRL
mmetsp:Transcript_21907/g.43068  ORF Transcript_21907/g.43068 Transcript_21907/m.43068 type:complete len:89 (-) Transcript_21907:41-307(-)